ncbi:hypothetical protein FML11_18050 [Klebsiella oxytoca]|nr:hypothetical protein [Klebsiella oxytoca]MBZ7635188.1 hypothetical protein [Klebsiella oxytoca]
MSYTLNHNSSRQNGWHYTQLIFRIKRLIHKQVNVCLGNHALTQKSRKKWWYGSQKGGIKPENEKLFYI